MKIQEKIQIDVAILTVSGSLMSGPDVSPFHDHIRKLSLDGINNVVVGNQQSQPCAFMLRVRSLHLLELLEDVVQRISRDA